MARDPPPKYVLYGMIGVSIVAIIAILVVFLMSNRAPTNVANGGSCTASKQCLSGYCNNTDPTNPVCDCAPDGTTCDSTVSCCGSCNNGKCYSDPVSSWISIPGYNASSSGFGQISTDETTCESKCGDNCIGISYFNDAKTCTLVNSLPTDNFYNDGVTTYMKKTSGKKITVPGTFVGQTPGGVYNNKKLDECSSLCKDSCVAYSHSSDNTCWLANDLNLFGVGSKDANITTYIL